MKTFVKNSKGFTMVEVLISLALLGALIFSVMRGISYFSGQGAQIEDKLILQKNILNIVESIQSNVGFYQVNFQADDFTRTTKLNEINKLLPMAWSKKQYTKKEDCEKCPGRLGFIITPLSANYRGMYQVRIRVTHTKLLKDTYKDYLFVIKGK